jgi:hypothetical protein
MDAAESIGVASESFSFFALLLIELVEAFGDAIDDILPEQFVVFILVETAEEELEDDGQLVGEVGLRQVEVHVAEDVELPDVEGRTRLHSLAE